MIIRAKDGSHVWQIQEPPAYLLLVTVSMRVIHSGDGYRYLTSSVAAADGDRDAATPLTRYYAATGTPPGYWQGTGVADLGNPALVDDPAQPAAPIGPGEVVTEEHLARLLGQGRDPVTGQPLGRAYPSYDKKDDRCTSDGRAEQDPARSQRRSRAVAGYDFTFSVPKSLSVLWAVADAATQALIAQAHHDAIAEVIAFIEQEIAATRTGANSVDGAVAQVPVTGVIAACFDHFDSRASDPQLHTHVVISGKVKTGFDGKWRALDSRPIHQSVVAVSELYNAILADRTSGVLGIGWEQRQRGRDRNPAWEITGVPQHLIEHFSTRTQHIDTEKDRLIDAYVAEHGHQPSPATILKLRQQATLATRPDKTVTPLSELTCGWRDRAAALLGTDPTAWAHNLTSRSADPAESPESLQATDITADDIERVAADVVAAVSQKRSTWRRWNLHAEASRQSMGLRFATAADRETVTGRIVEQAEATSVRLTPPDLASTPEGLRRADGTSVFRPKDSAVYTSATLLAAEDTLLQLTTNITAPLADPTAIARHIRNGPDGVTLSDEQARAVEQITASGRALDVLVGAAGAGKTSTMRALRLAWEQQHGTGSVIGLAPSARAADVLATELAIGCENTAKWLHEHRKGRWNLQPGHLVIVDEASLAATSVLHEIAVHAAQVGAKVLLVGDPAQLGAVGAGGAFTLLASELLGRGELAELLDVRRFKQAWEKRASLRLREGDASVLATYDEHGRLHGGTGQDMTEAAYAAWRDDLEAGKTSVLVAETQEAVAALNQRARADRIRAGHVDNTSAGVGLHDGTAVSAGDLIVTRHNQRRLLAGTGPRAGFVRNGDVWTVIETYGDGSVKVRRAGAGFGGTVVLPASYVVEHVELAYATTVHRAQGITVDTAHVLVASARMVREAFYVAMTRGRHANTAYVATDQADLEPHQRTSEGTATAVSVLTGVLKHVGAEPSAHQAIRDEQERWSGIGQLAAEYDTIAADAQRERWAGLVRASLPDPADAENVLASQAYGPLSAQLRKAEAHGHNVDELLPRLANSARGLRDADDIAAVLQHRLAQATSRPRRQPDLIAGLIPKATGAMSEADRQALDERRTLIEQRARTLALQAVRDHEPWTGQLGRVPADPQRRMTWLTQVATVAAYRDRYGITTPDALGSRPQDDNQRTDADRAAEALAAACRLAHPSRAMPDPHYGPTTPNASGLGSGPGL